MAEHGVTEISGALFDLGVSSPQLDRPSVGSPTATTVRSTCGWTTSSSGRPTTSSTGTTATELARDHQAHGDERFAGAHRRRDRRRAPDRDARPNSPRSSRRRFPPPRAGPVAIRPSARSRRSGSRSTANSTCCPTRSTRPSPATVPGGRIAVLSYHSGEDRIVKQRFAAGRGRVRLPARPALRVWCHPDRADRARHPEACLRRRTGTEPPLVERAAAGRGEDRTDPEGDALMVAVAARSTGQRARCGRRAHRPSPGPSSGVVARRAGRPLRGGVVLVAVMVGDARCGRVPHPARRTSAPRSTSSNARSSSERERFDELRHDRAVLRSPHRIADEAAALGMVRGETSRFVEVDPMQLARQLAAAGVTEDDTTSGHRRDRSARAVPRRQVRVGGPAVSPSPRPTGEAATRRAATTVGPGRVAPYAPGSGNRGGRATEPPPSPHADPAARHRRVAARRAHSARSGPPSDQRTAPPRSARDEQKSGSPRRRLLAAAPGARRSLLIADRRTRRDAQDLRRRVVPQSAGAEQWTRSTEIVAHRGTIFDRHGNELAMSVPAATISINPKLIENGPATVQVLDDLLELSDEKVAELLAEIEAADRGLRLRRPSGRCLARRPDRCAEPPGDQRRSPRADARCRAATRAQTVLGRTNIDGIGIAGLELQYDDLLTGTGGEMTPRDRAGRPHDPRLGDHLAATGVGRRPRADDRPLDPVRDRTGADRSGRRDRRARRRRSS